MQARFVESDSVNTGRIPCRKPFAAPGGKPRNVHEKGRPGAPLSPGLTMNDASLREPVHSITRRLRTCYKRCPSAWPTASILL